MKPDVFNVFTDRTLRPCQGWGGGGGGRQGGGPMSLLWILKPGVGVHESFTSLSEIERKFFAFVGILKKGDSDAL